MLVEQEWILVYIAYIEWPAVNHTGCYTLIHVAKPLPLERTNHDGFDIPGAKIRDDTIVGWIVPVTDKDYSLIHCVL